MEKKTFMRRPLDELVGQNYLKFKLSEDQLLDYGLKNLSITNHQKKELLWWLYLQERRLT